MSTTSDCQLSIKPRKNWFAASDAVIPRWKDLRYNFQPDSQGHQKLQKRSISIVNVTFKQFLFHSQQTTFDYLLFGMFTEVDRNFLKNIISRK